MAKLFGIDTGQSYGAVAGESSVGELLALVLIEAGVMIVLRYVSRHHHGG